MSLSLLCRSPSFGAAVLALLLCLVGEARAQPAPACADPVACDVACDDGRGDPAACLALGDALATGAGVTPDPARALRVYRAACGLPIEVKPATGPVPLPAVATGQGLAPPPPPSRGGAGREIAACKAAAELHRTGDLFAIERDPTQQRRAVERALFLARGRCTPADTSGCAIAAWAARARMTLHEPARGVPVKPAAAAPPTQVEDDPIAYAERGCTQGRRWDACVELASQAYLVDAEREVVRLRAAAAAGLVAGCTRDADLPACRRVLDDGGEGAAAALAVVDGLCTRGAPRACALAAYRRMFFGRREPAVRQAAGTVLREACGQADGPGCDLLIDYLSAGDPGVGAADPAAAVALAERLCTAGNREGCQRAATLRGAAGPVALRDPAKARTLADRTCMLSSGRWTCAECRADPTLSSCQQRAAFRQHEGCLAGRPGTCAQIAARFQAGEGVAVDRARATDYLRRGCDAGDKGACGALATMCTAATEPTGTACAQALIHSDLFYEAEYQLGVGGDVDLVEPAAGAPKPAPSAAAAITVADLAATASGGLRRGRLDADLVVDIVLDRARQAAVTLVVDELVRVERRAPHRYLRDLLDQGAALLLDPTTLRREKFQDLGMTVVRAFVASNLIESLFPTTTELRGVAAIGATITAGAAELETAAGRPVPPRLRGYLVDVAYYWLGQTPLLGPPDRRALTAPTCPWKVGAGQALCAQLTDRATVENVLGVAKVLEGLRLARALRDGGFDDVRRLIEAIGRSRVIADLGATPGLDLGAWQRQLVAGSRERLVTLREGLTALRSLMRVSAYGEAGLDLPLLRQRASAVRAALESPALRLVIGQANVDTVLVIIRAIDRGRREDRVIAELRQEVLGTLAQWGARDAAMLADKLSALDAALDTLRPALDRLEASIADVRGLLARYPTGDGRTSLDIGNLPLYATGDLVRELRKAQKALGEVDAGLQAVFPGEVPAQLRFARGATVRLVGFLDLMARVARSSVLTQKTSDVIASLRLLGAHRGAVFEAPLFDVLEPVIGALRTHEPMSLELLFAVIGRVRLDTLIGALQGRGDACADEASVDCWTTKLIHALQESVERDGEAIRIDGGKFAQRLARHGDDFRKRHTWRGYFHLTVGVAGLYSDPVGDPGAVRRSVPLISEQVGIGWASPSFAGNRLTFKIGAAASGLLYRAVLDSAESKAVMLHPLLLAVDIGELIEVFVSPAMLMVYPPDDDRGSAVRWGISAGLSVPLAAYLERL